MPGGQPHQAVREVFLQVHITSRCNLACKHCYSDAAPTDMDLALFGEVLDQFAELAGGLGSSRSLVQITGGEPLVHPDIERILSTAASRFPVRVLSNGTLIDTKAARMLKRHCEAVQVSLDGLEHHHDAWRGEGSFEATVTGIGELRKAGVPCSARMTLARQNQGCVDELLERLGDQVQGFNVSRIVPIGPCDLDQPDTTEYRRTIYNLYARHFDDPRIRLRDPFFGVLMKVDHPDRGFRGCSAGISGVCVTDMGDILPCRRLPVTLGNVRSDRLIDVYRSHPLMAALRARELGGKCGRCENRSVCGGSRCVAYGMSGDPLAEDPGCIFE